MAYLGNIALKNKQLYNTWFAKPWRGPAKPFIPAANERYGSESGLPT